MTEHSKAASLAARLVEPNNPRNRTGHDDYDDDEALFDELEAEIENDADATIREQGLALLKLEMDRKKAMEDNKHGQYTEITDEKQVVRVSAHEPKCVIHFYHSNFKRCEIMDKHLAKLAPKYYGTRFVRVFVENVPWLVEKLAIKVLPCVIGFVNGVTKDRLVGFEELGNTDAFETATLEWRLARAGVIEKAPKSELGALYKVASSGTTRSSNADEFDLDD